MDTILTSDVAFAFYYVLDHLSHRQWYWRWPQFSAWIPSSYSLLFYVGVFLVCRYQLGDFSKAFIGVLVAMGLVTWTWNLLLSAWFYVSQPFFIALGMTNQPNLKGDPVRRRMRMYFEVFRLLSVYCWHKGWKDHAWIIIVGMLLFLWTARATALFLRTVMWAYGFVFQFIHLIVQAESVKESSQTIASGPQVRAVEEVME
ncbi:hypothetical protein B0T14DRAFT_83171 [Immersiella caudata]|uniref:Uncharacterized protein n=1 Tax=Immersiella caudata TaxID=314043 RepID=A0AA39XH02_9PEZI|nr:hypothetical protein B0T14DRAFT_83171 [Immersiella caudata]